MSRTYKGTERPVKMNQGTERHKQEMRKRLLFEAEVLAAHCDDELDRMIAAALKAS